MKKTKPEEDEMSESFLYVIHCDGFHKVGISKSPNWRIATIQAMNPHPVTPVMFRRVHENDERSFEIKVHSLLRDYRVHGEWFSASLAVIRKAAELAARRLPLTAAAQAKFTRLCETYPGSTRTREFRVKRQEIMRELFDAHDMDSQSALKQIQ